VETPEEINHTEQLKRRVRLLERVDSRENLTQGREGFQVVDSQLALPDLSFIKHYFELLLNSFL
jgi:hypothetical protein